MEPIRLDEIHKTYIVVVDGKVFEIRKAYKTTFVSHDELARKGILEDYAAKKMLNGYFCEYYSVYERYRWENWEDGVFDYHWIGDIVEVEDAVDYINEALKRESYKDPNLPIYIGGE
tara:strand:+ start:43 stop:393 length:351 start_codon:yes stop_codon:yes gene_type:complete